MRFRQQWEVAKLKALLADGLGPCERRLALAVRTAYNAALVRAYRCALTLNKCLGVSDTLVAKWSLRC